MGADRRTWGGGNRPAYDPGHGASPENPEYNRFEDRSLSGAEQDVLRYRQIAAQSDRAPIALDQTAAAQARGMQLGSLGYLSAAAAGQGPSRAAELGHAGTEQSLRDAAAAGGGLMARRNAMGGAQRVMASQNLGIADMRAGEVAKDMGAYFAGGSGMRAGDLAAATENARLAAQQRALDEQRRQAFERLGFDTRSADLSGRVEAQRNDEQAAAAARANEQAARAEKWNQAKDYMSFGLGALTGATSASTTSDARAKIEVGSLAGLRRR